MNGASFGWPFHDHDGQPRRHNLKLWIIGPILLPLVAVLIVVTGEGEVYKRRLLVFCLIPVLVLILSYLFRKHLALSRSHSVRSGNMFPAGRDDRR